MAIVPVEQWPSSLQPYTGTEDLWVLDQGAQNPVEWQPVAGEIFTCERPPPLPSISAQQKIGVYMPFGGVLIDEAVGQNPAPPVAWKDLDPVPPWTMVGFQWSFQGRSSYYESCVGPFEPHTDSIALETTNVAVEWVYDGYPPGSEPLDFDTGNVLFRRADPADPNRYQDDPTNPWAPFLFRPEEIVGSELLLNFAGAWGSAGGSTSFSVVRLVPWKYRYGYGPPQPGQIMTVL